MNLKPEMTAEEFVTIQPMMNAVDVEPIFHIDFVVGKPEESEWYDDSPWMWRTLRWNDGSWIANYNNDVFEMEYAVEGFKIVRLWRHQLKRWVEPTAEDYGELRRISKTPQYEVRKLRELRDNPKPDHSFTKFAFPLINRQFPSFYETSYVTKSADRVAHGT